MALTKASLVSKWKTKIQAITNYPDTGQSPIFSDDRILEALAEGIVEEIQANADVLVTGVTTGGSTAPGTIS